ncbi:MAG: mannitol dehydrogenase family protein [Devosiaceae bacterium]
MTRLSDAILRSLNPSVLCPAYNRASLKTGIVHLGLGAFHRAHMASYIEACLFDDPRWGICGVSLRSSDTRDALSPQNGLYSLGVEGDEGLSVQVIGALQQVVVAPQEPERLEAALLSPDTRIVSLTITEKGYCYDPATGRLNLDHPDIQHDLTTDGYPRSAIGWLARSLLARRQAGLPAFTLLSCDNLPSNGALLRQIMLDYLQKNAPEAIDWAQDNLACPSTMVDRIVPATTDENRAAMASTLGVHDAWPVMSEPFSQFVVEDNFPQGRPAWEPHGVTMAGDVEPYEKMKLRMLNGSHSTIAYLGFLAGHETVADTIQDVAFRTLIHDLMTLEVMPTLQMPEGIDLPAYRDALLLRFANTTLKHKTYQIAMDGSLKLPQRLLDTIRQRLMNGQSIDRLALGIAAWMRYVKGIDEAGKPITIQDPIAEEIAEKVAKKSASPSSLAQALMGIQSMFGDDLANNPLFVGPVVEKLEMLTTQGAQKTVQATNALVRN